jgi:hypothetical protein
MLYPDAEALGPGISSGVPQFDLKVLKRFVVVHQQSAASLSLKKHPITD